MRTPDEQGSRFRALDGLRGLAAIVVLFHHAAFLNQSVYAAHAGPASAVADGSPGAIITRSPLQLLFSGEEAVLIFFVLSGFVLALPVLRTESFSWLAYFPRRLIRLVVPVVAAVLVAGVLVALTLGPLADRSSHWVATSSFDHFDTAKFLLNLDLFSGEVSYDNPLWSLHYELIFSILLPLYIGIGLFARRRPWIAVVAVVVLSTGGALIGDPYLQYLPIFFVGTLLAALLTKGELRLPAVASLSPGRRNVVGAGALLLALVLLEARWVLQPLQVAPGSGLAARGLMILGASALVLLAITWRPVGRLLEARIVQWLGRISFSLYLIHVPILLALSSVFRAAPWWVPAVVGVPSAVLCAVLFRFAVEQPAHRLARRVGRAIARRESAGSLTVTSMETSDR